MPSTVAANMDSVHALTLRAAAPNGMRHNNAVAPVIAPNLSPNHNIYGSAALSFVSIPHMAWEDTAKALYAIGMELAAAGCAAAQARASPDYRQLRSDIAWWLQNKPEVRN